MKIYILKGEDFFHSQCLAPIDLGSDIIEWGDTAGYV
jgi:hypothetical protein